MNSHQRRIAKRQSNRRRVAPLGTLAKMGLGSTLYRVPDIGPLERIADAKPFTMGVDLSTKQDVTAIQMALHGNVYTLQTRSDPNNISEMMTPGKIVEIVMGKDKMKYRVVSKQVEPDPSKELTVSYNLEKL